MRTSTNWDTSEKKTIRIRSGQGLAGLTMIEHKAVRLDDAYESKHFNQRYDRESGYVTRSVLCVPLLIDREGKAPFLLGVLQLLNKLAPAQAAADDDQGGMQGRKRVRNSQLQGLLSRSISTRFG